MFSKKEQTVADMAVEFKYKQAALKASFLEKLTSFMEIRKKKVEALEEAIKVAAEEKDVATTELNEALEQSKSLTTSK